MDGEILLIDLKNHIGSIENFPKPGILFYDIATLLAHPQAWRHCIQQLAGQVSPFAPDLIMGIESRGFLTAAPLAYELGCGFAMIRKQGKLPGETCAHSYELEYGTDTLEIQSNAITHGQRIVIMDDLLATGGTACAAVELIRSVGGVVTGLSVIIELEFLSGRDKLESLNVPISSLITYDK